MDRNRRLLLGGMENYSKWTVLGNDTVNLAQATIFPFGPGLDFDKTNGLAGKKYAGAYRTISLSQNTSKFSVLDRVIWPLYVSSVDDISTGVGFAFVWLGTSSSNYIELRYDGGSLTAGRINICSVPLGHGYLNGTGAKLGNITWIATGVQFDGEDDALAEIYVGEIFLHQTAMVEDL